MASVPPLIPAGYPAPRPGKPVSAHGGVGRPFLDGLPTPDPRSRPQQRAPQRDLDTLAARLLRGMLTAWEDPSNRAPLLETITAATSDPQLRRLAAEAVEREIVIPIAERIGGKEAQHRAAAFCAQMSGILFSRYLLRIEPIASMAVDDIIKALTPSLTATLWPAAPHPSAARTRTKGQGGSPTARQRRPRTGGPAPATRSTRSEATTTRSHLPRISPPATRQSSIFGKSSKITLGSPIPRHSRQGILPPTLHILQGTLVRVITACDHLF